MTYSNALTSLALLLLLFALMVTSERTLFPRISSNAAPAAQEVSAAVPTEVYYRNCAAARAAGAAPIHIGEPGYAPRLDADHDGIACEPWPR